MMVQFGFSDHARPRRSRAITAILDLPKPLPTGHSLFNPAQAGGAALFPSLSSHSSDSDYLV